MEEREEEGEEEEDDKSLLGMRGASSSGEAVVRVSESGRGA